MCSSARFRRPGRRANSSFRVPAVASNALAHQFIGHARFGSQFANRLFTTLMPNTVTVRTIIALFGPCRPAAILGGIRPVAINPIKRLIRAWPGSHVLQEMLKAGGPLPPSANHNTASAINPVGFIVGILAALQHAQPNAVFWGASRPMRRLTTAKAATGATIALYQAGLENGPYLAAKAATQPSNGLSHRRTADNGPAAKNLTRKFVTEGCSHSSMITQRAD